MKLITLMLACCLSVAIADDQVIRLSEPVLQTDTYEVFGAPLPQSGQVVTLEELVSNSSRYLDQDVLVNTRIAKVCQKKGCFFIAQEGDAVARITFRDYGFFVPTDSGGKDVVLAGTFTRRALSAAQAEHLADDLGETNPEPLTGGFEYAIEATSVRIPRG